MKSPEQLVSDLFVLCNFLMFDTMTVDQREYILCIAIAQIVITFVEFFSYLISVISLSATLAR